MIQRKHFVDFQGYHVHCGGEVYFTAKEKSGTRYCAKCAAEGPFVQLVSEVPRPEIGFDDPTVVVDDLMSATGGA